MKLSFTPEIILGMVLIVWGISILVKIIWGIDIPVFKPLLGLLLIYLGLVFIFGVHRSHSQLYMGTWHKRDHHYHDQE